MPSAYGADAQERRFKKGKEDYRGAFGRDRDRILYSSGFRRLAGKTQVLPAGELGGFHNRMTHSLKVAQIGRRLAERIKKRARGSGAPDPELVEAACLAHDLGHPPFGHAGEEALNKTVDDLVYLRTFAEARKKGVTDSKARTAARDEVLRFGGFEGNAQTFRCLVWLSARQPAVSRGLDLTRATLDATIKYPWLRGSVGRAKRKWNFYPDDLEYGEWVRHGAAIGPDAPKSFEALLMDWSDDVSYACHDVEDFFRAGLIPLHELFAYPAQHPSAAVALHDYEPEAATEFFDWIESDHWNESVPWDRDLAKRLWNDAAQTIWIEGPFRNDRLSKAAVHRTSSALITYFVDAVKWTRSGPPCLHNAAVVIEPEARFLNLLLQKLNWYYVINRPALASIQIGQQRIVRELLEIYATCGDERLLPEDRREEANESGDALRACVDHIASLTEDGAIALHHRLTGIRPGLHTDSMWRS